MFTSNKDCYQSRECNLHASTISCNIGIIIPVYTGVSRSNLDYDSDLFNTSIPSFYSVISEIEPVELDESFSAIQDVQSWRNGLCNQKCTNKIQINSNIDLFKTNYGEYVKPHKHICVYCKKHMAEMQGELSSFENETNLNGNATEQHKHSHLCEKHDTEKQIDTVPDRNECNKSIYKSDKELEIDKELDTRKQTKDQQTQTDPLSSNLEDGKYIDNKPHEFSCTCSEKFNVEGPQEVSTVDKSLYRNDFDQQQSRFDTLKERKKHPPKHHKQYKSILIVDTGSSKYKRRFEEYDVEESKLIQEKRSKDHDVSEGMNAEYGEWEAYESDDFDFSQNHKCTRYAQDDNIKTKCKTARNAQDSVDDKAKSKIDVFNAFYSKMENVSDGQSSVALKTKRTSQPFSSISEPDLFLRGEKFKTDYKTYQERLKSSYKIDNYDSEEHQNKKSDFFFRKEKVFLLDDEPYQQLIFDPNVGLDKKQVKHSWYAKIQEKQKYKVPPYAVKLPRTTLMVQELTIPKILVFGGVNLSHPGDTSIGQTVLGYHPLSGRWEYAGKMVKPRNYHTVVLLDDVIFIIGGCDPRAVKYGEMMAKNSVVSYNLRERRWKRCANMLVARSYHNSLVIHGKIYAIGGRDHGGRILETIEMYNKDENKWQELHPMPYPVMGSAACVFHKSILMIGGVTSNDGGQRIINTVIQYDPECDSWSFVPALPIPIAYASSCYLSEFIWVFGGLTTIKQEMKSLSTVFIFDTKKEIWFEACKMSVPRHCITSVVIESCVFLFGGASTLEQCSASNADTIHSNRNVSLLLKPLPIPITGTTAIVLKPLIKSAYSKPVMKSLIMKSSMAT